MKGPRCPSCRKPLLDGTDGTSFPFCSPRCKTIDLGSWLDERFRIAPDEGPLPDAGDDEGIEDARARGGT